MKPLLRSRRGPTLSLVIEHGLVKLLTTAGRQVLRYHLVPVTPRYFREGLVSNRDRVAQIIAGALREMDAEKPSAVVAAIPGFQANVWIYEAPGRDGIDPGVLIPQDAQQQREISTETSYVAWKELPPKFDHKRWVAASASRRAIASVVDTLDAIGLGADYLEVRPFSEARALNAAEGIVVYTFLEGCDVAIVRDAMPVEYGGLFWGAEPVDDRTLVNRLVEVTERVIASHNASAPEGPLSEDVPVFVSGSPVSREPAIAARLAETLGRVPGEFSPALDYPADFPLHDLIVNVGLAAVRE